MTATRIVKINFIDKTLNQLKLFFSFNCKIKPNIKYDDIHKSKPNVNCTKGIIKINVVRKNIVKNKIKEEFFIKQL